MWQCAVRLVLVLALATFSWTVGAGWKDEREALDERHVQGPFRIYYTLAGSNAFTEGAGGTLRKDMAESMVHRLGEQLQRADHYYSREMGLASAFDNPRYGGQIKAIDVHLLKMDDKKGSTGDALTTFRYRQFRDWLPALSIRISTRWRPTQVTPEHEVFHTYQYGYTHFKNAWFLEGMARSMESAFRDHRYKSKPLPAHAGELDGLLSGSYDAAPFWNRLMVLCDTACPVEWSGDRYYQPVHAPLCGKGLVRSVLEEFRSIEGRAAQERGIDPRDWPEEEQRSPANVPWMLRGLARAVELQCPVKGNAELARFVALLNERSGAPAIR
jgi:hypothetical protein